MNVIIINEYDRRVFFFFIVLFNLSLLILFYQSNKQNFGTSTSITDDKMSHYRQLWIHCHFIDDMITKKFFFLDANQPSSLLSMFPKSEQINWSIRIKYRIIFFPAVLIKMISEQMNRILLIGWFNSFILFWSIFHSIQMKSLFDSVSVQHIFLANKSVNRFVGMNLKWIHYFQVQIYFFFGNVCLVVEWRLIID